MSKIKNPDGYILIRVNGHPRASKHGSYVKEHVLVMEKHIGRYITTKEHVHHINHNRSDNRLENLELLTSSEHSSRHRKEEIARGKPLFNRMDLQQSRKIIKNRICMNCGGKTYVRKSGKAAWYKSQTGFICSHCYNVQSWRLQHAK